MKFALEPHERQTALWQKLEKHFEKRLEETRRRNDNALGEVETAKVRGRIAEIKAFLALGEDPAPGSASSAEESPLDW